MKKTIFIRVLTVVIACGALCARAQAQNYVSYPGAVVVINQAPLAGNQGKLSQTFSEADLMRRAIAVAWSLRREGACKLAKAVLGQGDLIAKGITLYDIDCSLGQTGDLQVQVDKSPLGNRLGLRYFLRGNYLAATSTTPTAAGKYADPRVSCTFDLDLRLSLTLPTKPGPITVQLLSAQASNAKLDSHNAAADIGFALSAISKFFGGPDFIAIFEKIIDDRAKVDFAEQANQTLDALNRLLAGRTSNSLETIEAYLNLPGQPGAGTIHGQTLPPLPEGGPQLIFVRKRVPLGNPAKVPFTKDGDRVRNP